MPPALGFATMFVFIAILTVKPSSRQKHMSNDQNIPYAMVLMSCERV
jgi:hypothetical protein